MRVRYVAQMPSEIPVGQEADVDRVNPCVPGTETPNPIRSYTEQ